jgi:hypothetical protein
MPYTIIINKFIELTDLRNSYVSIMIMLRIHKELHPILLPWPHGCADHGGYLYLSINKKLDYNKCNLTTHTQALG